MDITQSLKDAENSLRDFISSVLFQSLGTDWVDKCGVSPERLAAWKERKVSEEKRQESGVVDERLIYYADFYDLKTILKKHWSGEFSEALGDWKTFEVWLTELEKLRDPDAHRRELLQHQKHLAIGICGEIRSRIVRYRSRKETTEDCFPKIESARDNLGNIWVPNSQSGSMKNVFTEMTLRPGDSIEYIVTASDPEDLTLEYGIDIGHEGIKWQSLNSFEVKITAEHISRIFKICLYIKSSRDYHASHSYDDYVEFFYKVLPPR
jgi:hypothetical protein